ncbi:MFS family permease [Bradyrhizobium barranii subsp. barranii]|nr:MFS family permease [Bradyrhizobium japonicum]MCP1964655.1 MFS family permease [Bradyrhizobium japonicum]
MTAATGVSAAAEKSTTAHVVWASALGTAIEWYDFLIYGTAAALVFNKLFFPSFDPFVGTLVAFSTYAVGFVARPIGGAIIGHYGDRLGRKTMLVATMIAMGLGTFLSAACRLTARSASGRRSCSSSCASSRASGSGANGAARS